MPADYKWFTPGDGIAREVITADIQRYLGRDALVKPGFGVGEHEGKSGYWISAYRNLTTEMIQDLKADSRRWHEEGRRVAYEDTQIHQSRQYWGPSTPAPPPPGSSGYSTGTTGAAYTQSRDNRQYQQQTQAQQAAGYTATSPGYQYPQQPSPYQQPAYTPSPATVTSPAPPTGYTITSSQYVPTPGYSAPAGADQVPRTAGTYNYNQSPAQQPGQQPAYYQQGYQYPPAPGQPARDHYAQPSQQAAQQYDGYGRPIRRY